MKTYCELSIIKNYKQKFLFFDTDGLSGSINAMCFDGDFMISGLNNYYVTDEYVSFISFFYKNFGQKQPITKIHEYVYATLSLWESSINYATAFTSDKWPSPLYERLSLYKIQFKFPSSLVIIEPSNFLSRIISIGKINSNSLISENYPPLNYSLVPSYPSELIRNCDFSEEQELLKLNRVFLIICSVIISVITVMIFYLIAMSIFHRKGAIFSIVGLIPAMYTYIGCILYLLTAMIYLINLEDVSRCYLPPILLLYGFCLINSTHLGKALYFSENNKACSCVIRNKLN